MADPIAPSRMMTCGGDDEDDDDDVEVLVLEWDKGKSMTDLFGSTLINLGVDNDDDDEDDDPLLLLFLVPKR